jgi:hypothetical protein
VPHNFFGITFFKDALGELFQALSGFGVLRSAAIIEDADLGALCLGIPHALSQLQMGDE